MFARLSSVRSRTSSGFWTVVPRFFACTVAVALCACDGGIRTEAVGVPVKVTADDVDAGMYVVVQVKMEGWTSKGNAKVTWSDKSYLAGTILDDVEVTGEYFSFTQRTKSDVGNADRPVTVTVSTSKSKSDDFTIRKKK